MNDAEEIVEKFVRTNADWLGAMNFDPWTPLRENINQAILKAKQRGMFHAAEIVISMKYSGYSEEELQTNKSSLRIENQKRDMIAESIREKAKVNKELNFNEA